MNSIRPLLVVFGLMLMVNRSENGVSITAALSPGSPTAGITKVSITGTASAGATVSDTSTFPDGTVHIFALKADGDGRYTDGPFVLQQLGTFRDVLRDHATGASTTISYIGLGNFSVAVNSNNSKVAKGQTARYTVAFTSVSGFEGTVVPVARNWSHIPGVTAWWSEPLVSVASKGSGSATFIIRTSMSTPAGTYRGITLLGTNGSVTNAAAPKISLTVD